MLDFLRSLSFDLQHLAYFGIIHGFSLEVEQLLRLHHHILEECHGAHFEITFHLIDFCEREDKALSTCHALDGEESFVQTL